MGRTARNLSPESWAKKRARDKKLNAKPAQIKKRSEANQARRKAKAKGQNIQGKDYHHGSKSFISSAKNRGMSGEGGRKKGVKK